MNKCQVFAIQLLHIYAFDGWYTDEDCTTAFTATTMPAENITLYAKWNAGQVNYTVNYYLQNVDGSTYPTAPSETVTRSGVTGQVIGDLQKSFEGFTPRADSPASIPSRRIARRMWQSSTTPAISTR